MGKTYRRKSYGYFRSPKGHKQALINKCRYKSIPPDSRDDISHCRLVYQPFTIARKLEKQGVKRDVAIKKIMAKFNWTHSHAEELIDWVYTIPPFEWID
jgi:hypothetical protein